MDVTDIMLMIMLIVGFVLVGVSWLKADLKCPPPKIIYRFVPKHTLDVQFGEENKPSDIYTDMFADSSPWIGGYELGNGKTYVATTPTNEI
jgi:hypothetical protein